MPATGDAPVVPRLVRPTVDHASTARALWGRLRASLRVFLRVMWANPLTLIGFILVVLVGGTTLAIVVVPAVTQVALGHAVSVLPYPAVDPAAIGAGPIDQAPSAHHWLGTDLLGRDVLSRVLGALPTDLGIGFAIAGFSLLVGGGLGLVAGYWDKPRTVTGGLSVTIMRVTDIFLAFPTLVLALAIAATLGEGEVQAMIAVMATWWPYYVRLTRGEVLTIKAQPYVTAARAAGVSDGRILVRHVLRNLLEPLLVYFTMDVGTVIVTYSTLSYIGVAVPAGIPEWGNEIQQYQDLLLTYPWMVWSVAAAIFVTVLAFSLLGDGLRDLLDPRSRRILVGTQVLPRTGGPAQLSTYAADAETLRDGSAVPSAGGGGS
jgi:peptide/nickel transport system permease protein